MDKLIIEVRINEYAMRHGNRHVPWSADEIGRDAAAIRDAGAAIIHYHARKADGTPAHDTAAYAAAMREIRRNVPDLIVHPTLGSATIGGVEERIRHIVEMARDPALKPDLASFDTGSTNVDIYDASRGEFRTTDKVFVNATGTFLHFARAYDATGVKPAVSCWTMPCVRMAGALMEMGVVREPAYMLLVCGDGGQLGAHLPNEAGLEAFLAAVPVGRRIHWTIACKEGSLLELARMAIARGGHVAVGLGDYHYKELGAPTNADLVRRIVGMARAAGREIATPAEARRMIGL